jgi:hypothetical protein
MTQLTGWSTSLLSWMRLQRLETRRDQFLCSHITNEETFALMALKKLNLRVRVVDEHMAAASCNATTFTQNVGTLVSNYKQRNLSP